MEFPLTPDVKDVQTFTICGIGLGVAGIVVVWSLWAALAQAVLTPVVLTLFFCFMVGFIVPVYARNRFGAILVEPTGLVLRLKASRNSFAWRNIKSVERADPVARTLPPVRWLVGDGVDNAYVVVRLRRRARMGLLLTTGGTETFGIPIGVRTLRLGTPDLEAVISAAQTYLVAGNAELGGIE